MTALALDHRDLEAEYDAVVVGSGYGGGVTAHRLAEAGWSVCVLERGREIRPGGYPATTRQGLGQIQAHTRRLDLGSPTGLFDLRLGRGMSVLVGCGLGGTSLINAGVMLPAGDAVFDERWPEPLQGGDDLAAAYGRAETMLGVALAPGQVLAPAKLTALGQAAGGLDLEATPAPVAVTFGPVPEGGAADRGSCVHCGNCVTGCNDGAKNTVLMTYLDAAVTGGAQVFTELRVDRVGAGGARRWRVHARAASGGEPRAIDADVVVLAAGTLGSTEILMRSALAGLPASRQIGRRFSGNGDYLGVAYDGRAVVEAMGARGDDRRVGPTISGTVSVPGAVQDRDTTIQDGVIPGALAPFMPAALVAASGLYGSGRPVGAGGWRRRLAGVAHGPYRGATRRTLPFLLMTNDDDDGVLTLSHDRLAISWPGAADRPSVYRSDDLLRQASVDGLDATYLGAPWRQVAGSMVTVHPLGGCIMADNAQAGAVDHLGRVFAGATGDAVHDGLHVLDGAAVPRPLGVNPGLTIAALAERASAAIVAGGRPRRDPGGPPPARADHGRGPGGSGAAVAEVPPPGDTPGIRWRERLAGTIDWRGGDVRRVTLDLQLAIDIDDLDALRRDITTPGRIDGQVRLAPVVAGPLAVTGGVFRMFLTDDHRVDTRRMTYDIDAVGPGGEVLRIRGHKVMHDDAGFDAWRDLTTLAVTVHGADGHALGSGQVRISVAGVVELAAAVTAVRAPSPAAAARMRRDFLRLFLGRVVTSYGKALATLTEFETPPLVQRPVLDLPEPEERWFVDGHRWVTGSPHGRYESLKLTRYRGGSKGPVLLAPGFAMAARSFLLRTTEQNLTEHLVAAGYDVWLFDYRAGIDLRSARSRFTLDDVARQDWPAAVAEVRRRTGADTVQIVGHCMGSTTALMATASGLEGVRSIVCSQNTLHVRMLPFSRLKARSRLAHLLQGAGVERLTPAATASPVTVGLDLAYRLNPLRQGERCSSPICRWVFAYFGPTHRHERLNEATHVALRNEFGPASLDAMAHIALLANRGEAVAADDGTSYVRPERLRVPILFLAGEYNRIFLPAGARHTYAVLREANPDVSYEFQLLKRYGHLDCIVGRNAHLDVFPHIRGHLDRYN